MPEAFAHLSKAAREALALPIKQRAAYLHSDKWVKYDTALRVLADMEEILIRPKVARMPCGMIIGEANNGKTHIMRKFWKAHPPVQEPEGLTIPVLLIEDLEGADERSFYNLIIEGLGFPNNPVDKIPKLKYKAYRLLLTYKVRVLALDEFNTVADEPASKQRKFLNIIKTISNRRQMSVIGAGTRRAFELMKLDKQFSSRFKPLTLPIWMMGHEWERLMASLELLLPLPEPSFLSQEKFARQILVQSEGTIGEAWSLLKQMAIYAMENNHKHLTADMIQAVQWVKPSERVTSAENATLWTDV